MFRRRRRRRSGARRFRSNRRFSFGGFRRMFKRRGGSVSSGTVRRILKNQNKKVFKNILLGVALIVAGYFGWKNKDKVKSLFSKI
jgi:hypothetical protein